jgi:hypothetical protein
VPEVKIPEKKFFLLLLFAAVVVVSFFIIYTTRKGGRGSSTSPEKGKITYNLGSYQETDSATDGLVPGFPDIPVYPQAKLLESKAYDEDGGKGYLAYYQTNDQLTTVFTWYRKELVNEGWEVSSEPEDMEGATSFLLEVVKEPESPENNILLSITGIKQADGTTKITITHHKGMGEYGEEEEDE